MRRHFRAAVALLTCTAIGLNITGCAPQQPSFLFDDKDMSHYIGVATKIQHADVDAESLSEVTNVATPITLSNAKFGQVWELELESAVHFALENGKVMRTLGGRRMQFGQRPQQDEAPDTLQRAGTQIPTVYDPAIIEADPNFGVEGALSQFDAQLSSSVTYGRTDRPQNFTASGASIFNRIRQQDLMNFNTQLTKTMATGTRVGVSATTVYDNNNSPLRETPSDYTQSFDVFAQQPLLQGAGLFYNRIAGPFNPFTGTGSTQFDGVVLARIRHDISLADFEAGVRNLVNEVENAYWDLYFGYRNLEALKVGRDSALATWQKVYALYKANSKGGEADKEAQSREQYYFFRSQVETAFSDLLRAESRLRFVMGLSASDGRLIAPTTEPTTAQVVFDFNTIHCEALMRSVELRQQKWRIKQRELELMASKNLLLPRLDATARYRWLGVGDEWWNRQGNAYTGINSIDDTNAMAGVTDGNFQESEIGLNFSWDIGFRRALSTVRQQQLFLAREKSVLQDQELELSHALVEAVRILDTNYTLVQTIFNRRLAAERQVRSVNAAYLTGAVTFDLLLDAQRRQADAESAYYRALADYNRSIAQVHFRKGSLLEYNNICLAEGPWPNKAYFDAERRAHERDAGHYMNYGFTRPNVISRGPYDQHQGTSGVTNQAEEIGPGETVPMTSDGADFSDDQASNRQPMNYNKRTVQASAHQSMSQQPVTKSGSRFDRNVTQTSAMMEADDAIPAVGWRGASSSSSQNAMNQVAAPAGNTNWKPQTRSNSTGNNEYQSSQPSAPARNASANWQRAQR